MDAPETEQTGQTARKRRNRWEEPDQPSDNSQPPDNNDVKAITDQPAVEEAGRKRRSRWGNIEAAPAVLTAEEIMQQTLVLKLQLQQVSVKLGTVAKDALRIEQDPNRSPSPPPRYDSSGKRTNTREVRMREALNQERVTLIDQLVKLNPGFQPPSDFIRGRPTKKVYIPKHPDPNFNYIGLIIGPRGNTQKQMEQDTGCKISIRGKGSAKDGAKNRGAKLSDEDDELHVHVSGDSQDNVDKAARMIEKLLTPIEDHLNEHKQRQLRELALINGTLREDEYCPVCGEKGHRQFECPYRAKAFKAAGVKCSICGDLSHPTRDCPLKQDGPVVGSNLDSEYDSFLAELGDGRKPPASAMSSSTPATAPSAAPVASSTKSSGPTYVAPILDMLTNNHAPIVHTLLSQQAASAGSEGVPLSVMPPPPVAPAVPVAPMMPGAAAVYADPSAYASALAYQQYMQQYAAYYGYAGYSVAPLPPSAPVPPLPPAAPAPPLPPAAPVPPLPPTPQPPSNP